MSLPPLRQLDEEEELDRYCLGLRLITRSRSLSALLAFGIFTRPVFAGEQKDVIVMKNGDHLSGKIKRLENGVLSFDLDYVDGTLSVDWRGVARVESSALFIFTLNDGSLHSGKLVMSKSVGSAPAQISIVQEQQSPLMVENSDVVRIVPTSESFLNRFGGSITSGSQYAKGNHTTQFSVSSDVEYRETNWGAQASYSGSLSSSTGALTSTRNEITLLANKMLPWKNYFYGGSVGFLQSSVQGIQHQTNLGGGIGRYLKNSNRMRFSVMAGLGWQATRYVPTAQIQGSQNIAVGLILLNLDLFSFKKTRLDVTASLAPALTEARNFAKVNTSYYIKLFGKIDWNLSFYGSWDTKPPTHLQSSDYGTTTGLSYTFGNK